MTEQKNRNRETDFLERGIWDGLKAEILEK